MSARYNPRKEHSLKRSYGFRIPKKSFLIVCEGENTEPEYFNAFRLTSATVKAVGKGLGTMSLVKEALAIRKTEKAKGKTFEDKRDTLRKRQDDLDMRRAMKV